ncbi:glycosyl transferase family protein [Firmicutes bacterium CAG:882]|nr:glycosyl transferase family protein [Firmicutes bacterium CAG:882]
MIIVEPCAGLGNRFLGMASAYHWAQQTGDELTVLWKTERVMGARNEAVFSLPDGIRVIHAKDFGYKDKPFSHFRYQMLEKKLRKKADYFSDVDMTNDLFVEKGNAYYEEVMKNNDLKFIRAFSQFHDFSGIDRPLEFIKPTDYVREKADSVISGVDSSSNIGVHIRRTDNQVCINNSPLEVFIEAMEKEIEKDDRVTFYIASDDLDTILELKRRFGDRIYYMAEKNFERDSDKGIADAFAELICLSHANKIIGSFYSTYSRIAAMLSGIELEVVKKTDA